MEAFSLITMKNAGNPIHAINPQPCFSPLAISWDFLGRYPEPRFCQTRVPCLRKRRNKASSIALAPHIDLARHRGGSRSARRVICGKRAILWPPDHVLPEVPSSLALIFRSKISSASVLTFFRDKYSAPRISPFLASLASSYPSSPPDSHLLKALNYVIYQTQSIALPKRETSC